MQTAGINQWDRIRSRSSPALVLFCFACDTPDDFRGLANEPPALEREAGFIELEPQAYCYSATDTPSDAVAYQSSSAKLFYVYTPAEEHPDEAPVYVLYNGGPGSATTGDLRSFGTAPYTLTDGDAKNAPALNGHSWSTLGNLLYIDARQAGFSYSSITEPSDAEARARELSIRNFNLYLDAADVLRVLLRFLAAHPTLRKNRIVFVGESYGGTRTALILHYLLDPDLLVQCGSWFYADPELVKEIRQHHRAVYPGEDENLVSGAGAARQFSHQILIQPVISPYYQFRFDDWCGPQYGVGARAAELGVPCPAEQGQNDIHNIAKPTGWLAALDEQVRVALSSAQSFRQLIGVEPKAIQGLLPSERTGAFRGMDLSNAPADLTTLSTTLGQLPSHDHYYLSRARYRESDYGGQDTASIKLGRFFLRDLIHVKTFITRALLDTVVNADRLPVALAQYANDPDPAAISDVTADVSPRDSVARAGWITVTYTGQQFDVEPGAERVIRFPTYRDAGHVVGASSPEELYLDVRDFMQEPVP